GAHAQAPENAVDQCLQLQQPGAFSLGERHQTRLDAVGTVLVLDKEPGEVCSEAATTHDGIPARTQRGRPGKAERGVDDPEIEGANETAEGRAQINGTERVLQSADRRGERLWARDQSGPEAAALRRGWGDQGCGFELREGLALMPALGEDVCVE